MAGGEFSLRWKDNWLAVPFRFAADGVEMRFRFSRHVQVRCSERTSYSAAE